MGEHWFIEADPTSLVRVVPPAGDLPNGNDSAATITIIPSEKARELPSGSSHVQPIRVTGPVGSIIISVQFNITENQTKIPPQSSDNEVTISGHGPFRGLRIANVSSGRGVVIMGLPHESNEGLRVGDVITVVNGRRIANIADLRQALREGDTWNVDAVRGDLTFSRVFGR